MLSICGGHCTDIITLQYRFSCQLKNILKKTSLGVLYNVDRVFKENFLCNSAPSVQAKIECNDFRNLFS